MALFESTYTPPGVETTIVFNATSAALTGAARIPVLIGEGVEYFTQANVEMHRGSSATADDQIVGENLSNQVTGTGRNYQVSHFPVVVGDGTGTVTNNPQYIQVTANGLPVNVVQLNGALGTFQTQTIIPTGSNVLVTYFFKKTDTYILNENWSSQIPAFPTLAIQIGGSTVITLSTTIPGALGNVITLALVAGSPVSDAQAVSGAGTNAISINITAADATTRTVAELAALVNAAIPVVNGYLTVASTVSSALTTPLVALSAASFTGGSGPSTNTAFYTNNVPIVDGTNGGIVTNDPTKVVVKVGGTVVPVASVNGATGLVTLKQGVTFGQTGTITYYTNTYQNTSDQLPGASVQSLVSVGYGPGRNDFTAGVDYVLAGNSIAWGANANTTAASTTDGYTPFDATSINTTLVDQQVFLRPATGLVNSKNAVFQLQDVPVDGSGLGRPTNNPGLIQVYVGPDPITAQLAGTVAVASLNGAAATVTLYNPPAPGSGSVPNQVWATYYRSLINDHTFTLTVDVPGIPGQGSFTIEDEASLVVPHVAVGTTTVSDANFTTTGIVWPHGLPSVTAAIGGAAETVTLTFQDDHLTVPLSPPVQASVTIASTLVFTLSTPGPAGDAVTIQLIAGGTGAPDAGAITVTGNAVSVELLSADQTTVRTWEQVLTLFQSFPPTVMASTILCTAVANANLSVQASAVAATHLAGGSAGTTLDYSRRFLVTTSRTQAQANIDLLGLTGGATTPSGTNTTLGLNGYLGQTYSDPVTGFTFTIVDPHDALGYGYTQLPSPSYYFHPGDTITFVVNPAAPFITGTPTLAIPGIETTVVTTYGMNSGDTAAISTFSRAASEPNVGEYYYVTFTTAKQASDFALQTFTDPNAAYQLYGQPNQLANRLSIGVELLTENGAGQFACLQVPVQTGLTTASDQSFIDAINSLSTGLGQGRFADVIIPLSTSATVQQALGLYLTKQAAPRQKQEAIGIIGFDQYTSAIGAAALAQSIHNNRVIAVMPNAVGIMIQQATGQQAIEYLLTGEFVAAALAGLNCDPANDVATTLTGQQVTGFSRSLLTYDGPTKDQMAVAGITVLNDAPGALEVRHYKTTDPSNALTSEPYVTTISDFIAQVFRKSFKQFIGRKLTSDLPNTIELVGNSLLLGYMGNLITEYQPCSASIDANDPTTIDVAVSYVPVFSTLYINVTFTVNLTS